MKKLLLLLLCVAMLLLCGCSSKQNTSPKYKAHIFKGDGIFTCIPIESYEYRRNVCVIRFSKECKFEVDSSNVVISKGHCPLCDMHIVTYGDSEVKYYWSNQKDYVEIEK